jgi:hypothetical protein
MKMKPCTAATIAGRWAKAIEFFESAEDEREGHPERANAWVTAYILAGVAAADVICCRGLGRHAQGDNHAEAVSLLRSIRPDGNELGAALAALLAIKTKAGYDERGVSAEDQARAPRRAKQLLDAARKRA